MATLTTKLDAVNTMLGYVTEAPVNSIANTTSLPPSAALAKGVIDEVSREVQQDGWHFNTAQDYKLEANASNKFVLPDNVLQVDTVDTTYDVVQRGTTLFDRKNYTDVFTEEELKVNITFLLEYEELPEQARRYIALKASRMFANRLVGSREIEALIYRDEIRAKAAMEEAEGNNSDRTIFDNYDTATRIGINRRIDLA
ncbi:tail protein [uncultured phage_MedDCM-OCT-S45-C18]|uniref:Tail tubular protein A n=1 Tax=uncultured phage_MedDCM-OCT-S45-C18 TaxID=2741072 RepID=A0A6S4P7T9_9CAUD|nr:tail protein [uncultured phage_MedDCM-OCT-S45-C18]BAQ94251.1 tail tubular protein A [uncultured phage_MedDCM-OCT-S45-C18]